ncbi:MAG: hypothetical protein C4576_06160 [Desulfobacteraceae bacterium]|nr:MAG: hypothetical protein C4576_06160 [Desulfobacteraceae bacterium]
MMVSIRAGDSHGVFPPEGLHPLLDTLHPVLFRDTAPLSSVIHPFTESSSNPIRKFLLQRDGAWGDGERGDKGAIFLKKTHLLNGRNLEQSRPNIWHGTCSVGGVEAFRFFRDPRSSESARR